MALHRREQDFDDDDQDESFTQITPGLLARSSPNERPGAREDMEHFLGVSVAMEYGERQMEEQIKTVPHRPPGQVKNAWPLCARRRNHVPPYLTCLHFLMRTCFSCVS